MVVTSKQFELADTPLQFRRPGGQEDEIPGNAEPHRAIGYE
jgi:hypothetical protein